MPKAKPTAAGAAPPPPAPPSLDARYWPNIVRQDLHPAQPEFIVALRGFLAPHECRTLCDFIDRAPLANSSAADRQPKKGEAYLDRQSLALVDEALSTAIWRRLRPHLPDPLDGRTPVGLHGDGRRGAASQLKFYRYLRGHRFGQHVDQSWRGDDVEHNTEYTLLIYLNTAGGEARWEGQPLVGGDTVFHATAKTECARVSPEAGMALLHAHGRRCLMHEGEEVMRGAKYLLRADVMYRRVREDG